MGSPPAVTVTSSKLNKSNNGGGKNNSDNFVQEHMVAIGNPAAMNDINRVHSSNTGNGEGGMLVNMPQQQQKNSLNMLKNSNGDNFQGMFAVLLLLFIFIKYIGQIF